MPKWTSGEVRTIGAADLLYLAARRADGCLRSAVPIWVVNLDGRLYVRSVNGREAAWFRGTQATSAGHIRAGGIEKDVTFVDVPVDINAQLDAGYRAKYSHSPSSVALINRPGAKAAALELVPS